MIIVDKIQQRIKEKVSNCKKTGTDLRKILKHGGLDVRETLRLKT